MATMQDWKNVLSGQDMEEDLFVDFIPRDGNDEFLEEAFEQLPSGQNLIQKIKRLLAENNNEGLYVIPNHKNYLPEEQLKNILSTYCNNVIHFLENNGRTDLVGYIQHNKIQLVYDNNSYLKIITSSPQLDSEIEDEIGYSFINYINKLGSKGFCLQKAILFLTKYDGITRYLLEDVVGFPLKSKSYYDLWKAGGDVYFLKDRILVLCEYGQS